MTQKNKTANRLIPTVWKSPCQLLLPTFSLESTPSTAILAMSFITEHFTSLILDSALWYSKCWSRARKTSGEDSNSTLSLPTIRKYPLGHYNSINFLKTWTKQGSLWCQGSKSKTTWRLNLFFKHTCQESVWDQNVHDRKCKQRWDQCRICSVHFHGTEVQ